MEYYVISTISFCVYMKLVPKDIVIRRVKYFNSDRMCVIISFRRWFGANVWIKFSWGFDKGLVFILDYFCSRMFIFLFGFLLAVPASLFFYFFAFCFCVFAFPASLFSDFMFLFSIFLLFCFSIFLCSLLFFFVFVFPASLSAFVLLCFSAFLASLFSAFPLFFTASPFPSFTVSVFFSPVCMLNETLEKPQMKPKYILKRS